MPARIRMFIVSAASLACLPWSHGVAAQEAVIGSPTQQVAAEPHPNPFGTAPLNSNVLAAQRGGTDTWNDMKLNGVVANNQAVNVTTGSNLISDGAFSGAAGLPMVIQNSGNNVLIQNATIVNVQMK